MKRIKVIKRIYLTMWAFAVFTISSIANKHSVSRIVVKAMEK